MQRIDALQYAFPDDFDAVARDLVEQLLVQEPSERLGADDLEKLKGHAFFAGAVLCQLPPSHTATPSNTAACIHMQLWKWHGVSHSKPHKDYKACCFPSRSVAETCCRDFVSGRQCAEWAVLQPCNRVFDGLAILK